MVGSGVAAGCGDDDGRPRASSEPRDDEIRATLDAVWAAVGADGDDVAIGEYGYTFAPDNRACSDLDRDDRWFGYRGSSGPLAGRRQMEIEDAIVAHLEGEGFTVERYRSTHPDSPTRAFLAVRGELVVDGGASDEFADINVRSGPCAPAMTTLDPELYERDEGFS